MASSNTQIQSSRKTCVTLSLIGMIIGCIGSIIILAIGIAMMSDAAYWISALGSMDINGAAGITASYITALGTVILFIAIAELVIPVLFYIFFKKYAKTNQRALVLPILAIIFGGILNLAAGIIWLCNLPENK